MNQAHKTVMRSASENFKLAQQRKRFEEGVRKINTLSAQQQEAFWAGYFGVTPRFYTQRDEAFDEEFSEYFRK